MDLLIWTSVESNVIIIAASLPTLRPVFLVIMGQTDVMTGRSNLSDRKNQYRLSSVSKDSSKVTKEPFPTDSVDIVGTESVEQILPPSRIRRTMDVTVNYDQRKEGA
ncbi:hypothetical protein MMC06_003809 [Schaereria dolodes]|nr:hypothetical protein [Schaereria dolodes]